MQASLQDESLVLLEDSEEGFQSIVEVSKHDYNTDDEVFKDHLDLITYLKPIIKTIFNIDQVKLNNITFKEMYAVCDFLFAHIFEGHSLQKEFTRTVIRKIHEVQKWWMIV